MSGYYVDKPDWHNQLAYSVSMALAMRLINDLHDLDLLMHRRVGM